MGYLIFGGLDTRTYGVEISGEGSFGSPARDADTVSVPGRNGDIVFDNGRYQNITVTYPAFITSNLADNLGAFATALLSKTGYLELTDSYHQGSKRLARVIEGINPKTRALNAGATFDLVFDCKPQRYLNLDQNGITFTASGTLNNGFMPAVPKMRLYGTGKVKIGDREIEVLSHSHAYIDIDCELMDARYGATNCNNKIKAPNGFPVIGQGATNVTLTGLTKAIIYPRWWKL